ncbi:MAG: DeoR family transcriptional regulator [Devosia sp.]|nr:DeoR family transcriptional regulator [Devosia sp.]
MIKSDREMEILDLLRQRSPRSIAELCGAIPHVSAVSIRRDVARLAKLGALRRTHGGAMAVADAAVEDARADAGGIDGLDAIVLPPVEGRAADTLRLSARRRGIPFLAESSPQEGGLYLGPDNEAAGHDLGLAAGRQLADKLQRARLLLVSLESQANTRARADAFLAGFITAFPGAVEHWRINGEGSFRTSLQASRDAFDTIPGINVVFGVNDHSVLAALEAADQIGAHPYGFSVGGEGSRLFEMLASRRKLYACAALFPEIVGMRGIDVLADAFAGAPLPVEIRTPHAIVTADNLPDYYRLDGDNYVLSEQAPARLGLPTALAGKRHQATPHVIGFMPHYPAHDWYRNMARAMERRARELGLELRISAPMAGIAREIEALRRTIAEAAEARVRPGETVLVNAGVMALPLAERLAGRPDITVVTNSFDVLHLLSGKAGGPKVILTSGEYQAKDRCLVGPSLGALFETLRVDKAFLSVDGISARFGASSADERLALAARRFVGASREVFVLADHSLVGVEANHRISPSGQLTELITDSGSLPADRMACASAGMRVTLANLDHLDRITEPLETWPPKGAASALGRVPANGRK